MTVACSGDQDGASLARDASVDASRPATQEGRRDAGRAGADARVDARVAPPDDSPPRETLILDECQGGSGAQLSASDFAKLRAGGDTTGMRYLYPYADTVFPRGLGAPSVMWEGAAGAAVYVRITADAFDYTGCVKGGAGRLDISPAAWAGVEQQTLGKSTPFTIQISTLDDGKVRGPLERRIIVARGSLRGSIYYNTYNGGVQGAANGAPAGFVERIKPGKNAEFFTKSLACTGCHAASANGERLITGDAPGYVFTISNDTAPDPAPTRIAVNSSFVGLAPNGKVYLTTATGLGPGPRTNGPAVSVPQASVLVETDSGNEIANSGFPSNALMPTFSPDGTLVTFSDQGTTATTLALMDYDATARHASNQRALWDAKSAGFVGWPFVSPDNGGVIFTLTSDPSFSGGGAFIVPVKLFGPRSELWMADVDSGEATVLAKAMGFNTPADIDDDSKSYLPFGSEELHQAYYPTISPVASGGYFWVFFDSVRHYGNLGLRRQLWGTAIEVSASGEGVPRSYAVDRSNPAFYVMGQVLDTANHRAFTALDPCLADGASCSAGIDCCGGFCANGTCGPARGCSNEDDACEQDRDCCEGGNRCINGFCGRLIL
jgi:hypothetical protein